MPDPAYKPPPTFSTMAKVAKRGAYMRTTGINRIKQSHGRERLMMPFPVMSTHNPITNNYFK